MTESLPFKVTTHYPYTEVEPWCLENIGLYDQDWYRIPADIAAVALFGDCDETYCFRTKHQAVLFALRWS